VSAEQRAAQTMAYADFLERKTHSGAAHGFAPVWMPPFLFDFQASLVEWAVEKGRAAIFADCGLGKGPMELVWAENVARKTGANVLILAPLAVSHQLEREAQKFGIGARRSNDGTASRITITNYERLSLFNASDFAGLVCDESSILKSFAGARRREITAFARKLPYRLLATATAAPNDFVELGTSSEALGYLGYMDMLNRFFKNDLNNSATGRMRGEVIKWRFKGHAELPFWRWVCSWARAVRRPSDLGFEDTNFELPPLHEIEHKIDVRTAAPGMLFALPAVGPKEQREERRRTMEERCEKLAAIVAQRTDCSLIWCNLNDEGKMLSNLIKGSIEVSGSDSDEYKESAVDWFVGNKCICNDPMFGAKLSECENTNALIHNTCAITTSETKGGGREVGKRATGSTHDGAKDTQSILQSGCANLRKSSVIDSSIQKQDCFVSSENTESLSNNIERSLRPDAQFVEEKLTSISDDSNGSTLTIAMSADNSVDYSARHAILDSESLAMTRTGSQKQLCTCGHSSGKRVLISKIKIFGFGLNLQNCAHVALFPSYSYEAYYQGIRRCYRFGQKRPVTVDIVTTEGELDIMKSMQRKARQADQMFGRLVGEMNRALTIKRSSDFKFSASMPGWMA